MNYLDLKVPPVRDERLKPCCAYGGTFGDLIEGQKQGCLTSNGRAFAQATGCQLSLAMGMAGSIPETLAIFHGPIGCGSSNLGFAGLVKEFQLQRGNTDSIGRAWFSTNLSESEVVNGGEQKLADTIIEADRRFRPYAIFVAKTCVPAIIGDDIDLVVSKVQGRVNAKLIPLHCEGFRSRFPATAYDIVYHGILRNLMEEDNKLPDPLLEDKTARFVYEEKAKRTVNLLNVGSMGRVDELELIRILKALDLEANILPCFTPPDKFVRAKDAALSVSICSTHDDYFVEHLKELYGIPFVLNTIPIGTDNTRRWLLEIADFFKIRDKAERFIAIVEAEVAKALEPYKKIFKGKRAFVSTGEIRAGAQAEMLERDLGMEVVGIRSHHYDEFGEYVFQYFKDRKDVAANIAASQPYEQVNLLARLKPDIFLGHVGSNVWAGKQGIPVLPIFGPVQSYMGYKGVFEVAYRLKRLLKNPSFFTTFGKNSKLPYKKSWFDKDPYTYIKQTQTEDAA
jgi:nitrogenase molybdenum-iron protein alpha chain